MSSNSFNTTTSRNSGGSDETAFLTASARSEASVVRDGDCRSPSERKASPAASNSSSMPVSARVRARRRRVMH
jgi:hypothetical protein